LHKLDKEHSCWIQFCNKNTRGQSQPCMIQSLQRTLEDNHSHDSEFTENTRGQSHSQPRMIQSLQRTLEDNHSHDSEFTENTRGNHSYV
jgi:hypothetical protein